MFLQHLDNPPVVVFLRPKQSCISVIISDIQICSFLNQDPVLINTRIKSICKKKNLYLT